MTRIENHCCGCAAPGYPCMGASCPNRRVEVHYCDICGSEITEYEDFEDGDGREICDECLSDHRKVTINDY